MDRHMRRGLAALLLLSLLCVGCAAGTASGNAATPWPSPSPSPSPPPSLEPGPSASVGGPPRAALAVEGGDPVVGDLGTYLWGDAGTDAPWLPGEPIAVGAGEPLMIALDPPIPVVAWTAATAPAGADPAARTVLAEGRGTPAFDAPGPGAWTLAVEVTFSSGLGEATYFWALTVPG